MYINHNGMAQNAATTLTGHYARLATSTERLSSGMRINHAADDAAGLAVSELMRVDIAALHQGVRNANDAISMIQTADGALGIIEEKLIRMKELAEQASTGTYDSTQRLMIDSEFQAMGSEITRIAHATDFNGIKLLDGSLSGGAGGATGPVTTTTTAQWDFNDAGDSSGNGHTLTTNGVVSFNGGRLETQEGFIGNASVNLDLSGDPGLGFALSFSTIRAAGTGAGAQTELFSFGGLTAVAYTTGELEVTLNGQSVGSAVGAVSDGGTNTLEVRIEEDKALHVILNGTDIGSIANANLGGQGQLVIGNTTNFGYATSFDSFTITEGKAQQQTADRPAGVLIHFGPSNDSAEDFYIIKSSDATLAGLGLAGVDIQTQERAQTTLNRIGDAQARHAEIRSYLGTMQNRLENTVTNLTVQAENLQNSESRIRDANVAIEMTNFVRNQVLTQSAVAMLSQANSMPQMAIHLLG